jgi:hypothetical protein
VVRYDHGPTKRLSPPEVLVPNKPSAPTPSKPVGGKASASDHNRPSGSAARPAKNWRELSKDSPNASREILVATQLNGSARQVGVSVATRLAGGVSPSGHRGNPNHTGSNSSSWNCDPWGCHQWSCSWSCGSSWCWWSYPWFWSWYYPCWWWYSLPYYYYDYCAYPASTVVYSEPSVIYVDRPSEAVGEGVVGSAAASAAPPAQTAPAAPAPSPLSIAAQRYLELGDRAFREGRYTDAVQFYAKAVEFAPEQGALYLVLSDALFAAGDYHYAAYAVRRALELDPALVESTVDKHGFYPDPKQFDEQLSTLERYVSEHTADRDARLVLGLNYLFGGRPVDAVRTLESSSPSLADDPAAIKVLSRARSQP